MSITTMTNQEKATQNPAAATEAPVKTEVAHWLNKKDENTFSEFYLYGSCGVSLSVVVFYRTTI